MLCPICQRPVAKDNPEYPFCSDRCRTVDLGNWATEKYVISTPAPLADIIPDLPEEEIEPGSGRLQ